MTSRIGLVREICSKDKHKLFHIPFDLAVQTTARRNELLRRLDNFAHLRYRTKETEVRTLTNGGYKLIDYLYIPWMG